MTNFSGPRPLERFFAHMGWDRFVREHVDFPLVDFEMHVDPVERKVYVGWSDKRTGEIGTLSDDQEGFPSATLVASFQLLVGPLDEILTQYNRILNRRTRRHLRR